MEHNIFAMEICARLIPDCPIREKLRELVVAHPAATSPGKKWGMLKEATQLLLELEDRFEKGCWDFFNDDQKALSDYDMWCNGMITEEGARKTPSGVPGEDENDRYMTFTISLLITAATPTARALERLCEIPQRDLWRRKTFLKILDGLKCVSFASVKSDVFYLIPGDQGWGLTRQDLAHEKFHYLRTIE